MIKLNEKLLKGAALGSAITVCSLYSASSTAGSITQAIKTGKAYFDFNLRYEDASSGVVDVEALTLRSKIGYKTGSANGFSAQIEFEDVRPVLGIAEDDALGNTIADPAEPLTELDQAFIQYTQGDKSVGVTAKLGRQVITHDNMRHVGHVAWRQDKQTYDAGRVTWKPVKHLVLDYSHVYRVNRINSGPNNQGLIDGAFADVSGTSIDLFNVSYQTPYGKAVAYSYNMSEDGLYEEIETLGASFKGKAKVSDAVGLLYGIEFATQDNDTDSIDTEYSLFEVGANVSGVTVKLAQETLGSDDGTGNLQTPLATEHAFLGWADVFLGGAINGAIAGGDGIVDQFVHVSGKAFGTKLLARYHDYESDEGSNSLGNEWNLLAVKKLNKFYSVGLKYADFRAPASGALPNVQRYWIWANAKF